MTLTAAQIRALRDWIASATHLEGEFFRSVSMDRMEPEEVLGGHGAAAYGGRFASKGTRAVFLSTTDSGTGKETTERKKRLGGEALINTDKYPRIIFVIDVNLAHVVRVEELKASPEGQDLIKQCLDIDDLQPSKAVADFLVKESVQGLIFPSVVKVVTTTLSSIRTTMVMTTFVFGTKRSSWPRSRRSPGSAAPAPRNVRHLRIALAPPPDG